MKEIPPFLIRSSAANKTGSTSWHAGKGGGAGMGGCHWLFRCQKRLQIQGYVHPAGLTAMLERWEPWRAFPWFPFRARRISGLRHAPVDCHCSGGNVPVVAPSPRLLHSWIFAGCFSAPPLHPKASRARGMIAVTSAPSTTSLPLMCQSHHCVNTNPDLHFFFVIP